jgi:hypothetical protein
VPYTLIGNATGTGGAPAASHQEDYVMQFADFQATQIRRIRGRARIMRSGLSAAGALLALGACLGLVAPAAHAATLTRSMVVPGTPSDVWALIGPYCAIKDWLPPVGSCTATGGSPLIRTLVTKDGQATFVERQVARSERDHYYSYEFVSSPLPVSHYRSTIKVTAQGPEESIVTWSATYTPDSGRDAEAKEALRGIYAAGLTSIRLQASERVTPATAKRSTP